ncbi:MAG: peptidoglycan DD-metalloendopeptidase family protein [Nocardioidaceae bacterium]|nr:peptidoglycan DD-metalloendopeptidase family protein [Nocardioidaceae bacterium]
MPSRRRRLTALAALLVTVLTASVASPSFASRDDDLQDKRHGVNQDLKAANQDLDESSAELIASSRALVRAQRTLAAARASLADTRELLAVAIERDELLQAELDAAEERLAAAEQALLDGQQEVTDAEDDLAAFVVNSYQYGSPSLLSLGVVLDGGSTTDFGERLSLAESFAGAQSASIDDLSAATTLLSIQEQQVADVRDEVAARRAEAAENRQQKEDLEAAAQSEADSVRALVDDRRAAQLRADRAKQQDLRQIVRLERERDRIQVMLQRLALRAAGPSISVADTGRFLSPPLTDTYVTSSYGMRLHPILRVVKLHDGTDLQASCGTPIYAAAAGTVVSEYYNGGYGNRIIVSHGSVNGVSLATSYNHLARFAVPGGARVERGQLLGYAGTTGYSTGCHLHFMVYEDGVAVNPMGWL